MLKKLSESTKISGFCFILIIFIFLVAATPFAVIKLPEFHFFFITNFRDSVASLTVAVSSP
jgi:hypothetical protein